MGCKPRQLITVLTDLLRDLSNVLNIKFWLFHSKTVSEKFVQNHGLQLSEQDFTEHALKAVAKWNFNKKVLLRERKRHTARCVVSTHSVVLTWLTPPGWLTPPQLDWPPWLTDPPTPPQLDWPPPFRLDWPDPSRLDWPDPPPAGLTWPLPQLDWPDPPPSWTDLTPPQVWTDKQSETITFPSYYIRGR